MKKPIAVWLPRDAFLKLRYARFKKKKKILDEIDPDREWSYLTDMDDPKLAVKGKPLRDVLLCDRCNEDIEEDRFLMLEGQQAYHRACVQHEKWFPKEPDPKPEPLPDNVIPLFRRTNS